MRKHFRRKHSYAKRGWESPLHSKVFVSAIAGVFVGFILAAAVFSGMLSIFSLQSPVFTISDGEGFTNLEVSDGAIASVTFQDGETIRIGNAGGTNLLIESPGKTVYEITQRSMTPEEEYNLVGKATVTKPDPVPGNNPPNGYLDAAKCTYAGGWAKDPDTEDPIYVHIYFDPGTDQLVKQAKAGLSRKDVGDHAFHYIYPKDVLKKVCDGNSHTVKAYGIDYQDPVNGPNRELHSSPKTVSSCGYYRENGDKYACCPSADHVLDASGNCIEPGSGEYLKRFERYTSGTTIVNRVLSVSASCTADNMCVDKDSGCVAQWSAGRLSSSNVDDKVAYCGGGSDPDAWIDCDYSESRCNKCNSLSGITAEWTTAGGSGVGEYGTGNGGDGATECCGDDKDEYVISYGLKTACCSSKNMILDKNGNCAAEDAVITCTDSDNGRNYAVKGSVEYSGIAYNDRCYTAENVKEFYCQNNIKRSVVYDCGNLNMVCDGGKCVESTEPPETDSPPNGYLENADCSSVRGWSKDPDTNNSIAVHIYIDPGSNQIVKGTVASKYRSDLYSAGVGDGYHGFVYTHGKNVLKEICDGQKHAVRAYGINYPEDPYKNKELSGSPLTTPACGYYKENSAGDYACCDSSDDVLDSNGTCVNSSSISTIQGGGDEGCCIDADWSSYNFLGSQEKSYRETCEAKYGKCSDTKDNEYCQGISISGPGKFLPCCKWDPSCDPCGNGRIDSGEECDGTNLNNKDCEDLGYSGGTLKCKDCHFDTSGCTSGDIKTICKNGMVIGDPCMDGGGKWEIKSTDKDCDYVTYYSCDCQCQCDDVMAYNYGEECDLTAKECCDTEGEGCTAQDAAGSTMSTTSGVTVICCGSGYSCPPGYKCNTVTNECEPDTGGEGYCGDGKLDAGEECDDGDNWDGDGCSGDCMIEYGDGGCATDADCINMHGSGWVCADDRTCVSGDVEISVCPDGECDYPDEDALSCPEDCSGVVGCTGDWDCDEDKICVDGNCVTDMESLECWNDWDCEWDEMCADGICVGGLGEWGMCGDGVIDAGEECDDGDNWDGDGCSGDCMIEDGDGDDWGGGGDECETFLMAWGFDKTFAEWACDDDDD